MKSFQTITCTLYQQ